MCDVIASDAVLMNHGASYRDAAHVQTPPLILQYAESVDEQLDVVSGERSPIGVMDFGNIDIDGVIPLHCKCTQRRGGGKERKGGKEMLGDREREEEEEDGEAGAKGRKRWMGGDEGMRESEKRGESWTAEERHVPTVRPHEEEKKDGRRKKEEDRRFFR
ncbi:hypothetical protein EYF80_060206 [Liparis tanakae]|uniref:Uncharacterized protein n=1 Tax=Liparis tanakae TaxID=230148 RepID=A0A4Z2EMG0_9TELE|nr:hypothetical protein EYF80_060206 [Liparis tanakae]